MLTISTRKSTSMYSEEEEESQHSPLRFHSPLRSDLGDPIETPPYGSPGQSPGNYHNSTEDFSRKVSSVDNCTQWSPLPSPSPDGVKAVEKTNSVEVCETVDTRPPVVVVNKAARQDMMCPMTKVGLSMGGGRGGRPTGAEAGFRRSQGGGIVLKMALWFRVLELILSLISFLVMAADKTQGWTGDSFYRYKEYRYCLSVNVIIFLYSGAQACYLTYQLMTRNRFVRDYIHNYFDFFMDQIFAYLLVSASSSAATRVYDWIENWGGDKFTDMAGASVGMAFVAFLFFAVSALISGYNLCTN